jgi:hypothetical protein
LGHSLWLVSLVFDDWMLSRVKMLYELAKGELEPNILFVNDERGIISEILE